MAAAIMMTMAGGIIGATIATITGGITAATMAIDGQGGSGSAASLQRMAKPKLPRKSRPLAVALQSTM